MRTGGIGFLVLSLLGVACGRTSQGEPGEPPASGGNDVGVTGGGGGSPGAGGIGGKGSGKGGFAGGGAGQTGGTGTSGGNGAGGSGGVEDPDLSSVDLEGAPIYTRVQRLTNRQWENAVTDVLRFEQRQDLSARFARPPANISTFDNNERILYVDPQNFLDFEAGAEAAAAIATGSAKALDALYEGSDAAGFVREFGRRAFRRPLTQEEEVRYQSVFALGERLYGAGFANGAALVIRAVLQAPQFLYRTELGPAGDPLDSYELASKLSFWLLGTTPSDALLDAAEAGSLSSGDGLEATARELLDDPRTVESMRDFHGQLLGVAAFAGIGKVGVPEFDAAINPELALASGAFFDRIFGQDLGVRELLTSKQGYVGPKLAPFYGLEAPASGLELRELGPSRSGYFIQVPFLMLWGEGAQSDPIQRGYQLQAAMLCTPIGVFLAHPGLAKMPPAQPGQTNRQRVSAFDGACGSVCHAKYIDPLGFALESFDGLGRERELDNGQPVDTTGSYPFAEGVESFADGSELMRIMADSGQVHTCYSKQVTGYALGRDVVEGDRPLLESLAKVSLAQSLKEVVIALVRDPAFRTREEGLP